MRRLSAGLDALLGSLGADDEASRRAQRAAQVETMWRQAVEKVYKDAAQLVLDHVNAVYIMAEEGAPADAPKTMTVYVDDSTIKSDLDARQEFLKLFLLEQGEPIGRFRLLSPRFDMRGRHPFRSSDGEGGAPVAAQAYSLAFRPLTDGEREEVEATTSRIEDDSVRTALKKAMTAHLESKTD